MKATILDTVTGVTKECSEQSSFQWAENNWSCDCNRMSYFDVPDDDSCLCKGGVRFIVIKAEFEEDEQEYTLAYINSEYPEELLDKFLNKEK